MRCKQAVGILSYGVALPASKILTKEIAQAHGKDAQQAQQLGVSSKTVAAADEDTITLATQAGWQALERAKQSVAVGFDAQQIAALFIGSESHPYAVKPSGTVVKTALGMSDQLALADLQFACKGGTQSLQLVLAYLEAKFIEFGMAIGADTAQSKPGDVLEFTAGAGAAAFILGSGKQCIARCLGTVSIATDTPDFWRRPGQKYPEHAGRFSGEPGYFAHVQRAAEAILAELALTPQDFSWCVFHTPNAKFPQIVAKRLGFTATQLEPSLVVREIGNTYAAALLIAFAAVLDQAKPGQKILVVSYGSGAGADAFVFETTDELQAYQSRQTATVRQQIRQLKPISYHDYLKSSEGRH